jgi:hypothetical protein
VSWNFALSWRKINFRFAFCVVGFVNLIGKCDRFVSSPADGADISVYSAGKTGVILVMSQQENFIRICDSTSCGVGI